MKYCFIINPRAGKGDFVEELKNNIVYACERADVPYDIFLSETIGDTKSYIQDAVAQSDDKLAFFACGGDGTLCEIILTVMSLNSDVKSRVCVGIVPKGTGNDFVSNFTDKDFFCDIAAQIEGTTHDVDLLKCNDMYSVNMINIGFDCHVVCKKNEIGKKKIVPRKLAYIFSLIITLIKRPTVKLKRSVDGLSRKGHDLLLTTLANGAFCGGGFYSNPYAALDDGNIDCVEVQNIGRLKFLSLVGSYKKGTHIREKTRDVIGHFKCKTADIYFDEETPVSVDGEIIRTNELHVSVVRRALTILIPRGVKPLISGEVANDPAYSL